MSNRPSSWKPIVAGVIALLVVIVALPSSWKTYLPGFLRNPEIHFGLDLAGGTQLDFRISEAEIEKQLTTIDKQIEDLKNQGGGGAQMNILQMERRVVQEQQANIVEAIRTVLERRINALGVSEATITPSYIGGEKHLLVECPGVVDVQKCIETVGKTIQLEFKEEFTEATKEYEDEVQSKAQKAYDRVRKSEVTLQVLGQDLGTQLGIGYNEERTFYRDELPKGLEPLWSALPTSGVMMLNGSIKQTGQDQQGKPVDEEIPGIFLAQALAPKTMTGRVITEAPTAFKTLEQTEKGTKYETFENKQLDTLPVRIAGTIKAMHAGELKAVEMEDGSARIAFLRLFTPGREEVAASHILIAYKGATGAGPDITRTKEQALARAQELKRQLSAGANFEQLARTQSDGESKKNAGNLGPFARGMLVPAFEDVAFNAPVGNISDPVETPFGFHLIRVNKAPYQTADRANMDLLTVPGPDAMAHANTIVAQMQSGKLTRQEEIAKVRFLFFSLKPTGWKDTELDGKHFRSAAVTMDPSLNLPVVQIAFDSEGGKLFQELTKKNKGKRIAIFVGGELVSAPTVQAEIAGGTAVITGSQNFDEARNLAQDLNSGAIPAPIYLSGQRTVEATLGAQALATSLQAALIGMIILMIYLLFIYRFLGVIGSIALVIYATLFFALLKLPLFLFSNTYVVLTLAGTAGMILSVGMAVDANVLVFERIKEELRKGKLLKTAVETGFTRAWPSVRDSNVATLITCAILFMIGTSIVRGFAITLGMGVFISMLTGMVISRWLTRWIVATFSLDDKPWLFPGAPRAEQAPMTETTKI